MLAAMRHVAPLVRAILAHGSHACLRRVAIGTVTSPKGSSSGASRSASPTAVRQAMRALADQPGNRNMVCTHPARFDLLRVHAASRAYDPFRHGKGAPKSAIGPRTPARGIEHSLTKPYHPWTHDQVDRMNRTPKHRGDVYLLTQRINWSRNVAIPASPPSYVAWAPRIRPRRLPLRQSAHYDR